MLLEISSIPFVFGKTYTQVFLRFSAVARPASLANTGFSGLRHLAASSAKIIQAGFVPPVLKTVRAKVHRGSNPLPSAIKDCTFVYHDKSAVFSCFRTKSTQNGKKQAKRGFGAVNTAAARPFFHLHGR